MAGVDDPEMFQFQVRGDNVHRFRRSRGVCAFELETPPASAPQQKQIQFRATLGAVEVGLAFSVRDESLLKGESLPTRSVARMHR